MKLLVMRLCPASITFSFSGPGVLLRTLLSNTLNLFSSLNVRYHVERTYTTTDKMVVLYILIFVCVVSRREDEIFWNGGKRSPNLILF
jgi:hypothetical protein